MKAKGLYVHIPFCVRKCNYCDFCSFPVCGEEEISGYVTALCSEIRSYKSFDLHVDSVFFGGGTPSLLSGGNFSRIIDSIAQTFRIDADSEITLEANPGTLTEEKVRAYVSSGVNRFSVGLQTIHENELKKLGRIHSYEDFLRSYELIGKCGIDNVNVDLMYGIPDQTIESFGETLDKITTLSPAHLSLYGLIVEEGTPIAKNIESLSIPDEDSECEMYSLAARLLREAGYKHYEISNYAKEGKRCRHNLKYWQDEEYIGFGPSAYSYFNGKRFGNSRDLDSYLVDFSSVRENEEIIDIEGEKYEYVMLSLRLSEGFSLPDYKSKFGEDFLAGREKLCERLSSRGLLWMSEGRIGLTEKGFYVSNTILTELL